VKTEIKPSMRRAKGLDKARIAEAVHRAVCEVTGSDGSWSCLRYAHAGCGLLMHLGVPVEVEAGHLEIVEDGQVIETLRYTGYWDESHVSGHAWLRTGGLLIDFSARHFATYAGRSLNRTVPYIWGECRDVARYTEIRAATETAAVTAVETIELFAAAINHYEGRKVRQAVRHGSFGGMHLCGMEVVA
jgi:hypothetical protein